MSDQDQQREVHRTRWLGWVVIGLAVLFIGQGIYAQMQQQKEADCQYRVMTEFRQQIVNSRTQNNDARQALIDMVKALRESRSTDQVNAAMDDYLKLAEDQQQRAEQVEKTDRQIERC